MDRTGIPMISPRKEEKTHGIYTAIDGNFHKGQTSLIIDDVLALADSKLEVISMLRHHGLLAEDVLVFLDYEIGGKERLEEASCSLHSAVKISYLLSFYRDKGIISQEVYEKTTFTLQVVKTYFNKA